MTTPLDEYLETKVAAPAGDFARSMGRSMFNPQALGQAAGAGAVAAGLGLAGGAASKIIGAITKNRDFKQMMEFAPDLEQNRSNNPNRFNQQYSSLRRFNPAFAGDPVIASSYMRQMSEMPEAAGGVLVNAIGAAPREGQTPHWMQTATKSLKSPHEIEMQGIEQQKGRNALDEYQQMAPARERKANPPPRHEFED